MEIYTEEEMGQRQEQLQRAEWQRIFADLVLPEEKAVLIYEMKCHWGTYDRDPAKAKQLWVDLDAIYAERAGNKLQFDSPRRVPLTDVPVRIGSWGAAGFYRDQLRQLSTNEALVFEFEDADAFTKGRYSIITAARNLYGGGRTRTRSDKQNLTFYIWLREKPNPDFLPSGGNGRHGHRPANLKLIRKTDKPS